METQLDARVQPEQDWSKQTRVVPDLKCDMGKKDGPAGNGLCCRRTHSRPEANTPAFNAWLQKQQVRLSTIRQRQ
jgi:hypothetical protein